MISWTPEQDHHTSLYAKLPIRVPHIRLLQLHPADDPSDGIECTLEEHFLHSIPRYKALSYAWVEDNRPRQRREDGSLHRQDQINIRAVHNGESVEQRVFISKSLRLALRRLREKDHSMLLWIDSLCINQKDIDERTSQVGLMGMIYQFADEVIIWLGEKEVEDELGEWLQGIHSRTVVYNDWSDYDTSRALVDRYVHSYEMLRDDMHTGPVTQKRDIYGAFCLIWLLSHNYKSTEIPFYHAKSFTNRFRMDWASQVSEGLRAIMQRSWWRRAWVVQETVLARKATVVYSTLAAPWNLFAKAANMYLQEQLAEDADQRRVYQSLNIASASFHQEPIRTSDALGDFCSTVLSIESTPQEWFLRQPVQLLTLLRRFRSRQATNDRDKVFSLLGLVDRWMKIPLEINYSMSVRHLYSLTATNVIEEAQSLSILNDVNRQHPRATGSDMFSSAPLPSWIPDWTQISADGGLESERTIRFENYSAGLSPGHAYIHDLFILETKGHIIGSIKAIAPIVPQDAIERLRQAILGWEQWWLENTSSSKHSMSVFWETLCGGCLYNPQSVGDQHLQQSPYTNASPEEIHRAYQAWIADTTTQRNRKTAIIADLITNSYKEPEIVTQLKNSFYYSVRSAVVSRCFFTFERGTYEPHGLFEHQSLPYRNDIGIGPTNLQVGDIIYVPHGSKVPLLIRPDAINSQNTESPAFVVQNYGFHEKRRLIGPGDNMPTHCNQTHQTCTLVGAVYVNGEMYASKSKHDPPKAVTIFLG
ncbi:heterokaryon incompatibility protein-domain-containing protein [Phaeosphaeria sp. MPI-PUGE-AT-0046c]|nr:heterokaryon incompatibility protein-domain-containing protein [Phaeosphaeria sp. MPI-PUGE-AT-0046c]